MSIATGWLSWDRWWVRLAAVYVTSALSFMLAVQIEIAMVMAKWVQTWLDTPIFSDAGSLVRTASLYPVLVMPVFMLAELYKQVRRRPLPGSAYVVFSALFTTLMFAMYDFGQLIEPLFAFIKDDAWRRVAMFAGSAIFVAMVTAVILIAACGASKSKPATRP